MSIINLWIPIVVSAAFVFIASAAVWMAMPWHKKDFSKTSNEDAVRAALKGSTPGHYMLPHSVDSKDMENPEMRQKFVDGPFAYITVVPNGVPQMGPKMIQSFLYYLFVGVLCAYFVTRTATADADYLAVFRIAGTVAWIAYGIAYIQESIWFGRAWSLTFKNMFDALIYALLTGGVFGWLA
jgi:hypothetical protein